METIVSKTYKSVAVADKEVWLNELEENGFTVVSAVASEEDVKEARKLMWDWLEGLETGIIRDNSSTWTNDAWPDWPCRPWLKKYGSCKRNGAVHQGPTWFLRGLPSLKKVFSQIYNTEELLVSMDGMILWRPWENDESVKPTSSKLHMDQNPAKRPGFQCVQAMLPLFPVTPEIGGTVLVPGSHKLQKELLKRNCTWSKQDGNYCTLGKEDPLQGKQVLIPLAPGDLLLWDSRLVHGGWVGPGSGVEPGALARASLCVCMGPREKATEETLLKRKEALHQGWAFSHLPWEATGTKGQVYEDKRDKYVTPELSSEQLALV